VIVALSGGIGGAKLALGMSRVLPRGELTVIANIGDDFEHLGLYITPDIDTLLYTLAGLDNPELGWGRRDDTWSFMETLAIVGGETWFRLGDRDLALHVERTRRVRGGESLSAIIADFGRRLGVDARVLPASDDRVPTRVLTDEGWLDFQRWFVGLRAAPAVRGLEFVGAPGATALPEAVAGIRRAEAVVVCPSNPFISIDPILAIPGYREALLETEAPIVAISPIIGGRAVKGPTAKMMAEFGHTPSARVVAEHYGDLLDTFVADQADFAMLSGLRCHVVYAAALMRTVIEKEALARVVLQACHASKRQTRRSLIRLD
jgi:LPPG:FO 2-phospho-L-lactate transferase